MREAVRGLTGFRDFPPEEFVRRQHIFAAWRRVGLAYGFSEYDGPPLENLELYTRKSGAEIVGQLYNFTDKGGRAVALRPEMTPTFARMLAARAAALPKPVRWFSIPQLFRYERPQRGRLREHFQLNMDIVGETDPLADAEIIAAGLDALRALGLGEDDIVVRISDRSLMGAVLGGMGIPAEIHLAVFGVLDRLHKEHEGSVVRRLEEQGLDTPTAERLLAATGGSLSDLATLVPDSDVDRYSGRLEKVFSHLNAAGFGAYLRFDASLVRGLAYYTGTVFEIWDRKGELRAVCGGGRYDDLLGALGGVDLPALGFGMGDVVLSELLTDRGLWPAADRRVDDYIVCVTEEQRSVALGLAQRLRRAGRAVLYDLRPRGVGRQFKAANKAGASRALVIGPDEAAAGNVLVRDLASGTQRHVTADGLVSAASGGGRVA